MRTRIGSLLTGRSLATSASAGLPARLSRQPGTPARPRTPIGRGSGFKTRAVCVRVAPGAPCRSSSSGHADPRPSPVRSRYGAASGADTRRSSLQAAASSVFVLRSSSRGPLRGPLVAPIRWPVTEPPHMTPEQFRQHGHEVVDWIADYWSRVGSRCRCASQVAPGDVRAALPADGPRARASRSPPSWPTSTASSCPGHALAAPRLLRLLPGQHLRPLGARRPGERRARRAGHVLGDQPGRHRARAARAGLVRRAARPARSPSAPPAPAAASSRTPAPGPTWSPCSPPCTGPARARPSGSGVEPERATVYVSAETHSSMEKAVRIAGLGSDAVRIVEVDGDLAMRPGALAARLERGRRPRVHPRAGLRDRRARRRPTAVDPLAAHRARSAGDHGVWLHVDAAYAGVDRRSPRAARPAGRRGVGRQLHHRRAQVAAHRLRRHAVLGRRPGRADRRAGDPAGVPAQRRHRRRRGRRLPRLADPAGPPVPRAQAVVRAALVRRRGAARAHPRRTSRWPRSWPAGSRADDRFDVVAPHPLSLVCLRPAGPTAWTPTSPR